MSNNEDYDWAKDNWLVINANGESERVDLSDETLGRVLGSDGFKDTVETRLERVKSGEIGIDEAVKQIDNRANDITVFLRRMGNTVAESNAAVELMDVITEQMLVDTIDDLTKERRDKKKLNQEMV